MRDDESTEDHDTNDHMSKIAKYGIFLIVLGIILIIGIVMAVAHLFTSLGPIQDGINKVLGAGANALTAVSSGCESQADCIQAKDASSCNDSEGCTWSASTVSGTAGSCISATGQSHHGATPVGCVLGLFGLLAFIATLVVKGVAVFLHSKNPVIKEEVIRTGKSEQTVLQERYSEAKEAAEKTVSKNDIKDAETKRNIGELAANKSLDRSVDRMMESATDPPAREALQKLKTDIGAKDAEIERRINETNEREGKDERKSGEELSREVSENMAKK